ncbi:MAG: hypothetical protein WBD31_30065 [Rubripirellula sp.]
MFRIIILAAMLCTVGLTSAEAGILTQSPDKIRGDVEALDGFVPSAPEELPRVLEGSDFDLAICAPANQNSAAQPAALVGWTFCVELPVADLVALTERSPRDPHRRGLLRPS